MTNIPSATYPPHPCSRPIGWRLITRRSLAATVAVLLLALLASFDAAMAQVQVAGQLLVDLNSTRGLATGTGMSTVVGETNVIAWTNYGTLGGKFDMINNSVYAGIAAAYTNPPALMANANILAPESPAGSRLMVANFATPAQLQGHVTYTVECWFYNLSTANPRGVFDWTLSAPPAGDAGEFSSASTASWHNDANSLNWDAAGTAPSTSAWHYGVLTYDGGTERVYLDGVISNSAVSLLNLVATNTVGAVANPLLFSQLLTIPPAQSSSSMSGAIAALRVHTGTLSAAAVSNNFALGAGAVPLPPIQVAGQLLINLNYTTGITTATSGLSTVAGETNVQSWANMGILGGEFDWVENSVYANIGAAYQNAPAMINYGGITAPTSPSGSRLLVASFTTPPQLTNNNHYSVECWFYNNGNVANPRGVFAWTPAAANGGDGGEFSATDPASDHFDANSLNWGGASPDVSIPSVNAWHYGVITYDGSTEKVYLDGGLSNSLSSSLNIVATDANGNLANPVLFSQLLTIPPVQSSSSFNGAIASLRVHTDALTPAQVANNFAAGISGGGAGGGATGPTIGILISPATAITGTSATLNANLLATSSPSTTGVTFYYDTSDHGSTTNGWAFSTTLVPPQSVGNVSANTSSLTTGTTYFVRAYAFNSGASNLSSPASFRTLGAPVLTNSAAYFTGVGSEGVNAFLVNAGDGSGSADVILYWGTTDGKNVAASWQNTTDLGQNPAGATITNFLSGLASLGTYYYTFASGNSFGTTFAQPSVKFQEGLIYAVNTTNQPAPGLTEVSAKTWPSQAGPPFTVQAGAPTVHSFGGVPWINSHYGTADGFVQETVPSGTDLPVNGGSIVLAVKPTGGGATGNWSSLADLFFDQLTLAINPVGRAAASTHIAGFEVEVGVNVNTPYALTRVYIPSNVVTVLSLVATPDNNFILYTNGVVATNTLTGSNPIAAAGENGEGLTDLISGSGGRGYANSINLLRENPDAFSVYNGYLGDVYCYGEALPDVNRQALEAQLMQKFITNASLSYSIAASVSTSGTVGNTTGGTLGAPAGAGTAGLSGPGVLPVIQGNNVTYTMTPANGYAISSLLVDGTNEGAGVSSFTFSNVSTNHSILVQYVALPPQQIIATAGAGGNIGPAGTTTVAGGGNQIYTITPSNGFAVNTLVVDGVALANGTNLNSSAIALNGTYTFANVGAGEVITNHTVAVTFTQLSLPVPKSDQLILSLDPGQLPQTNAAFITNWPVYVSNGLNPLILHSGTPQTFVDANNVLWEQNVEVGASPPASSFQVGPTQSATVPSIPVNGFTITCTACPSLNEGDAGEPWYSIVDIFYGYGLGIRTDTGQICCRLNVNNTTYETGYFVPDGSNEVVSLVVQPSGAFAVYANTVEVYTNAGFGPITSLVAGTQGGFANNIDIGKNQPDPWPGFNGLIGDVFVYATALSDADRGTLENALVQKIHAYIPPNFNWVGANNANWSSVTSWSNTVAGEPNLVPGVNENTDIPVFSFSPAAGQTVQLDQSFVLGGLTFNSNVATVTIASANVSILTLDNGTGAATDVNINSGQGATPTISAPLNVNEGLQVNGPGTLNLSGTVSVGTSSGGQIDVAGPLSLSGNITVGYGMNVAGPVTVSGTVNLEGFGGNQYLWIAPTANSTGSVTMNGGSLTTYSVASSWAFGNGPGVGLAGYANNGTATLTLNGGVLITPNIGSVAENFGVTPPVLVPPATQGCTAILNLNGGVIAPTESDLTDPNAVGEGSAHLIFNTTHTWVQTGGAIISNAGFTVSIAVPLEHYPAGPIVDGGLTLIGSGQLTLLTNSTYSGPTVINGGILACEMTGALGNGKLAMTNGGQLELDFTGTASVYGLTFNGVAQAPGTYGATGSGATHIDNVHFVAGGGPVGTLTVLGSITRPSITSSVFIPSGAAGGGNGTLTLQGAGGVSGGTYYVLGTTNLAIPLANWTTIGSGTFTGNGFSISLPVTNTVPDEFITLIVP